MNKNMLIAASRMLEENKDPKVQCAKIVIDELVAGMSFTDIEIRTNGVDAPVKFNPTPQAPKDKQYKVMVDKDKKLMEIEGLPLDAELEIDGKIVKHKDAIGKPFNSGKIL